MKANEILQVLNLGKNKETINYCSKLANLFEFLKKVKPDIIKAEIDINDYTINQAGKEQKMQSIRDSYANKRLIHFRYNSDQILPLIDEQTEIRKEYFEQKALLYKKRKNKDNSELEEKISELESSIKDIEDQKEALIEAEKTRLQDVVFPIDEMRKELSLMSAKRISIDTKTGNYSFLIPTDNSYYFEVCRLVGLDTLIIKEEKGLPLMKIVCDSNLLDKIKKAAKFTSKDDLRPAMTTVCVALTGNELQVVATDAHKLYYSKKQSFEILKEGTAPIRVNKVKKMQLLISTESIKAICKEKTDSGKDICIDVFGDNTAAINGIGIAIRNDFKFPDYTAVIPDYKQKMTFAREQMIKNVKSVQVYANKSTHQVNLYLNGNIKFSAQDVDFSFESEGVKMPYSYKDFEDMEIGFNGTLLRETLSIFNKEEIDMYSEGSNTKASIFTDGNDSVLLMPLMINS